MKPVAGGVTDFTLTHTNYELRTTPYSRVKCQILDNTARDTSPVLTRPRPWISTVATFYRVRSFLVYFASPWLLRPCLLPR